MRFFDFFRKIWRKRIVLFWNRLFIREDELHPSLDFDPEAFSFMDKEEREKYDKELSRRRQIAHDRENQRLDKGISRLQK